MSSYLVRLEIEGDAENPKDAAREFFKTVHTDHDYLVEVRDGEENLIDTFTESDLWEDE